MEAWTGSIVVATALLGAPSESAVPFGLEWDAPSQCPRRDEVVTRVEALIGQPVSNTTDAERSVQATVAALPKGRWALHITTRTAQAEAERELIHDGSCETMAEAASTMIAIALDPRRFIDETTQTSTPESSEAPDDAETPVDAEPTGPDPSAAVSEPPRRARRRERQTSRALRRREAGRARPTRTSPLALDTAVAAFGGVGVGAGPRVGGVIGGSWGLLLDRARVELAGAYWLPTRTRFERSPDTGATFHLWHVGVRAGPRFVVRPRVELELRGGLELGQLRGVPFGVVMPQTQVDPWIAIPLGGRATFVPNRWLALYVGTDGVVPLRRPRFVVIGPGLLHRPSAIALRVTAGIELRIPLR